MFLLDSSGTRLALPVEPYDPGNATPLRSHDRHGESMLNQFRQDVRDAARMLVRTPMFTGVAILTLALGLGGNAAIFTIVNARLIRPLPYGAPDRLVTVWQDMRARAVPVAGITTLETIVQNRSRSHDSSRCSRPPSPPSRSRWQRSGSTRARLHRVPADDGNRSPNGPGGNGLGSVPPRDRRGTAAHGGRSGVRHRWIHRNRTAADHDAFGVGPGNLRVFAGTAAVLVAAAALAVIPARRAARVDPMVALRAE